MNSTRSLIAVALVLAACDAAASLTTSEKIVKEIPLGVSSTFWVDNPNGSIEIIGSDVPNVAMIAVKKVVAVDRAALEEGSDATQISIEGNAAACSVRTVIPAVRTARWSSSVAYTFRVPRWAHIKVQSKSAERIRVVNIIGNLSVRGFNGPIFIEAVTGATVIDTTNGSINFRYLNRPSTNVQLTTVNGDIEVRLPTDANFDWMADTLSGDLRTTMPVRGRLSGSTFRASVNAPGGPTLTTTTLLGTVYLLQNGTDRKHGKSIIAAAHVPKPGGPRSANGIRIPLVVNQYVYFGNIENIEIGEIRGRALIDTRAGSITLDKVWGDCNVTSLGGPLTLGEVIGTVFARTSAGDILVNAAREGGQIMTSGGSIRLLYNGGPTSLTSGGGDIVVAQAAGPINAETRSGDITISVDPNTKTQRLEAHTTFGNVIVNLTPRFGAEIDATVLTTDADTNGIYSDFNGLTTKREQVGSKTKIHTTSKINDDGEKLTLYTEQDDIHITSQTSATISVTPP